MTKSICLSSQAGPHSTGKPQKHFCEANKDMSITGFSNKLWSVTHTREISKKIFF